ncbi:MAG: enoyl-CoA hydratase/isomerase family protein [Mycobacterium sp.]
MSEPSVHRETRGPVLVLTIDRPHAGNALRGEDCAVLADAIAAVDGGNEVRAVLLRAEGKHFCTGADLRAANAGEAKPKVGHMVRGLEAGAHRLIAAVWNCRVPCISAVQGRAIGLGLHLAVVCDLVIAAQDAVFTERFAKLGFSVDSGGSFLLPRLVGLRRARQMLLRGVDVDAATALEWGLIDEVVDAGRLDDAAVALAAELAAGPTFSLGHTKDLLNSRAPDDLASALRAEADAVEATIRSADFKEGIRAFSEKRDPIFGGS